MNFRQYTTSSGKQILAGKSAENNEQLVAQAQENELLLHTTEPGSPFVNIKAPEEKTTKKDIQESACFCALHSQDFRDNPNKKTYSIDTFKKSDTYKNKSMKTGTFGVNKKQTIQIKKQDVLNLKQELNKKQENEAN